MAAEQFNRLVGALSGATRVADVVPVILDFAHNLGALAEVVVWRGAGTHLTVLVAHGYSEPAARLAIDAAHSLAHAVRTAEPVWLGSRSPVAWHDRAFDSDGPLPVQVALPLISDNAAIGALGLRFAGPVPTFAPDERAMILSLCGQCGQALDRARLHQVEHDIAQILQCSLPPSSSPHWTGWRWRRATSPARPTWRPAVTGMTCWPWRGSGSRSWSAMSSGKAPPPPR